MNCRIIGSRLTIKEEDDKYIRKSKFSTIVKKKILDVFQFAADIAYEVTRDEVDKVLCPVSVYGYVHFLMYVRNE